MSVTSCVDATLRPNRKQALTCAGPYGYDRHDIVSTLASLGYTRYGDPTPGTGRVPPEELVACLVYSRDYRWMAAVAVVLCKAPIDWDRMVRLAIDYGFPGTLRGMIEAVRLTGRDVAGPALDGLAAYESVRPDDIRKVLKTYDC